MNDRSLVEIQKATEGHKSLGGETTLEPIAHLSEVPSVEPVVVQVVAIAPVVSWERWRC